MRTLTPPSGADLKTGRRLNLRPPSSYPESALERKFFIKEAQARPRTIQVSKDCCPSPIHRSSFLSHRTLIYVIEGRFYDIEAPS